MINYQKGPLYKISGVCYYKPKPNMNGHKCEHRHPNIQSNSMCNDANIQSILSQCEQCPNDTYWESCRPCNPITPVLYVASGCYYAGQLIVYESNLYIVNVDCPIGLPGKSDEYTFICVYDNTNHK